MRVINAMTLAEIASALSTKANPLTPQQASRLRKACRESQQACWGEYPRDLKRVMDEANDLLKACGVESFNLRVRCRKYWGDEIRWVTYVNVGDTYNTTLLFWEGKYRIGSWGDLVERYDSQAE